jgi:hypothetical protein
LKDEMAWVLELSMGQRWRAGLFNDKPKFAQKLLKSVFLLGALPKTPFLRHLLSVLKHPSND